MFDWLETVEAMPVGQFSGVTAVLRVGVADEQASAQRAAIPDAILGSIGATDWVKGAKSADMPSGPNCCGWVVEGVGGQG
jgi:hypothetical protein